MKRIHLLVVFNVDAEMMQLWGPLAGPVLRPVRQFLQRHVVMFPPEAEKRHPRLPAPGGNLEPQDRTIEVLRLFQICHVKDNVPQNSIVNDHSQTNNREERLLSRQHTDVAGLGFEHCRLSQRGIVTGRGNAHLDIT